MPQRFSAVVLLLSIVILSIATPAVFAQQTGYRIVFGGDTGGVIRELARQAAALEQIPVGGRTVLSFGNLLGDTRIVRHNDSREFLVNARRAGIEYVIPADGEFLFTPALQLRSISPDSIPQFAAANILDERTREPLFLPFITRRINGDIITIIPIADPDIIRDSPDEQVAGIDIIATADAIHGVYAQVLRESPDAVILAGSLRLDEIPGLVSRFPDIDIYLTTSESEASSTGAMITRTRSIDGRPVYVGDRAPNRLSVLTVSTLDQNALSEFAEITLDEQSPVHEQIAGDLNAIIETLRQQDREEMRINQGGGAVAEVLLNAIDADVAVLHRESLISYEHGDSLHSTTIDQVVAPDVELDQFTLPGKLLKAIWNRSVEEPDRSQRLLFGGLTEEAKVDSIPLQDNEQYIVLATRFLSTGGHGYEEFTMKGIPSQTGIDLLATVEQWLAQEEERIRKASRPKFWKLNLYLTLNSNFERSDVNTTKDLYGKSIPKPFRSMEDTYTGTFLLSSQNNLLTYTREIGPHRFEQELKFSYSREGKRTDGSDKTIYTDQKNHDPVEQYNKYTYRVAGFPAEPYIDLRFVSVLYSGAGKHPLNATMSTGATRTFPKLLGLNVAVGLQATRDYVIPENDFGTKSTISFQHTFPARSLFSKETTFRSRTNVFWTPVAKYHMEFKMDSDTNLVIQLWKRINAQCTVRAYAYRNSVHKKMAVGAYYNFTINYGMNWDF